MLAVYVENPDEHFQRAQAAGAKILIRRRLPTSDRGSITPSIWKGIPGHLAGIGLQLTTASKIRK